MATDHNIYAPEYEVEQLREEIRHLREEQERQKQQITGAQEKLKPEEKKQDQPEQEQLEKEKKPHPLRKVVIAIVLIALIVGGLLWWLNSRKFEDTDDAEVEGHLSGLAARIAGTVTGVYVEENQFVTAGQVIANLDPRDDKVAMDAARSQLLEARAQSEAEQPNVPVTEVTTQTTVTNAAQEASSAAAGVAAADQNYQAALAKVRETEANYAKAQADVERYRPLADKDEVPREQFDQVVATAKALAATLAANQASAQAALKQADQSRAQLAEAQTRVAQAQKNAPHQIEIRKADVAARQAAIQGAQAQLDQARLNLSYCQIVAPVAGVIAKRTAELGQHVTPGQQIVLITQLDDLWVTANYKETQIRRMHPGQEVRVRVDALGRDYAGYLESMPAASGAVTSLLPPENATGNFVKVVQRMPVRIRFKKDQEGLDRLRPGMSVEPEVRVQ